MPTNESPKSAIDRIGYFIENALINGRLGPGSRLVEATISAELGVNRSSFREALRRLAARGLVEIIHNKGARIRSYTKQDIVRVQQIRSALEGLAARKAAETCRNDPLASGLIERKLAALDRIVRERRYGAFRQAEHELRQAILKTARSRLIDEMLDQLNLPVITAMFVGVVDIDRFEAVRDEYAALVRAIADGNETRAEAAIRKHIDNSLAMFDTVPETIFG